MLKEFQSIYYDDLYLLSCIIVEGRNYSNSYKQITNTIEHYISFHSTFNSSKINKVVDTLVKISKKDLLVCHDEKIIFLHIYKILFLIDMTNQIIVGSDNKELMSKSFSSIANVQKERNEFRAPFVNSRFNPSGQGRLRLRWYTLEMIIKNKKLARFFYEMFVLSDLEKIPMFHENVELVSILLEELSFLLYQSNPISAIIKNFAILLYFELHNFLKFSRNDSEIFTNEILDALYNEKVNYDEFHRNVYLKSTFGFYPIFGTKKNAHYTEDEKEFILSRLTKRMVISTPEIEKHYEEFLHDNFNQEIKNLHIQYLRKYPRELIKINPKYSHLFEEE